MVLLSGFLALAAAFTQVAAIGDLAFDLGVKDNNGNCKTAEEYKVDFETLKPYTNKVRFYSTSDCNTLQTIAPVAEEHGFKLFVGVWPTDSAHFDLDKEALKTYLPTIKKDTVVMITVGSEALYRKEMTGAELGEAITSVKDLLPNIKDSDGNSYEGVQVGFVDSWNVITDGSANDAFPAADVVLANAFAYWQGQTIANSSYSFFDDIMQALQKIQTAKGTTDITFWVGETGWPTDGTHFDEAEPSVANAESFWKNAICGIRAWGINVIVFEAVDEGWKPNTSGTSDVEKHWGVYDDNYNLKYDLSCDFSS